MTVSENLDLVRSIYAAWERGDWSSAKWAHPEVEWVIADGPATGTVTGPAAMVQSWADWLDAWVEYQVEPEEYREIDQERVLVLVHRTGRGVTTGLEFGQLGAKAAHVFHIRNGQVTRLIVYADRELALADLGLAAESD